MSELADRLMGLSSAEEFVRRDPGIGWRTVALLKLDVDRLVGTDVKAATRLVDRIEALASLVGDPVSGAYAHVSRARLLFTLGRHGEANSLYDAAISTIRGAGLPAEAAMIQIHQIEALKFLGRYQDAFRTARTARRSLTRAGKVPIAQLETNVGNVYFHLDRYKIALQHYDKARRMLARAGDASMRAVVDFCRSCVYIEMDRPDEALRLLESVSAAYERAGKKLASSHVRCQMAYLEYLRGNYNAALASYYKAKDTLTELGSAQDLAFYNLEIAEILLGLNGFDDCASSAEKALASFRELGMSYEAAKSLHFWALARMGLNDHANAERNLTEARQIFETSGNTTFTALTDLYLGELALRRGKAKDAASRAESCLAVFARQKLASRSAESRLKIASAAYMNGDLARASRMAKAALRTVEAIFAPGVSYRCHHLIGRTERDRKHKSKALASFRKAVDIVERVRGGIAAEDFKATFLRDKITVYEDAIKLCLDYGSEEYLEEAFRLVELSKSRALADLLARYVRGSGEGRAHKDPAGGEARAKLLKLIEDMNWYSSNAGLEDDKGEQRSAGVANRYRRAVARCERQIAFLFRRMELEGSSFAEIQRMQSVTSSGLKDSLKDDESAIEYFFAGDEISVFIASRQGVSVLRNIASKTEVEKKLAAFRFQIEKFNYGPHYIDAHFSHLLHAADHHLSGIYDSVFRPVEESLNSSKLVVIPHGALHYVPFHALHDGRNYLVDRFEMSYAPSAAVFGLCRSRPARRRPERLVVLGTAGEDMPGVEEELDALQSIFPDTIRLSGDNASHENLMKYAPSARFLHLASHGSFRRDNPMFSFLKLADSRLNFYSLLDLRLNAEMVTLSACRTGVNMVFPGDELHGLMRGFLYAGAPSLVVSLWAVSDRSTADFMGEMYRSIRAGLSKREALRRAQIATKDSYGHPYYWAPFVLMGDPA